MNRLRRFRRLRQLRRRRYLIILAVLLILVLTGTGAFLILRGPSGKKVGTSSSTSATTRAGSAATSSTVQTSSQVTTQPTEAMYVTSSPLNTSRLLVVESNSLPAFVYANNTGSIPEYSSLASLNESKIGVYCILVNQTSGECLQFKMFEQTGWFWDSSNDILYIKYVGGPAVELIVSDNSTGD